VNVLLSKQGYSKALIYWYKY